MLCRQRHSVTAEALGLLTWLTGSALAASGLAVSLILLRQHGVGGCAESGPCSPVAQSAWGSVLGIPTAALGALFYAISLTLIVTSPLIHPARRAAHGFALLIWFSGGAALSVCLQIYSLRVVHAICHWCLASCLIALAMAMIAMIFRSSWKASGKYLLMLSGIGLTTLLLLYAGLVQRGMGEAVAVATAEPLSETDRLSRALALPGVLPAAHQDPKSLGSPTAPIVITEYSDMECPYCLEHAEMVLPPLIERYVTTGKLLYRARHFPLINHARACAAAVALECAAEQGRYWQMRVALQKSGADARDRYVHLAAPAGVRDTAGFARCLESAGARQAVEQEKEQGRRAGVAGTPTFLFNDGTVWDESPGRDRFSAKIAALLSDAAAALPGTRAAPARVGDRADARHPRPGAGSTASAAGRCDTDAR